MNSGKLKTDLGKAQRLLAPLDGAGARSDSGLEGLEAARRIFSDHAYREWLDNDGTKFESALHFALDAGAQGLGIRSQGQTDLLRVVLVDTPPKHEAHEHLRRDWGTILVRVAFLQGNKKLKETGGPVSDRFYRREMGQHSIDRAIFRLYEKFYDECYVPWQRGELTLADARSKALTLASAQALQQQHAKPQQDTGLPQEEQRLAVEEHFMKLPDERKVSCLVAMIQSLDAGKRHEILRFLSGGKGGDA